MVCISMYICQLVASCMHWAYNALLSGNWVLCKAVIQLAFFPRLLLSLLIVSHLCMQTWQDILLCVCDGGTHQYQSHATYTLALFGEKLHNLYLWTQSLSVISAPNYNSIELCTLLIKLTHLYCMTFLYMSLNISLARIADCTCTSSTYSNMHMHTASCSWSCRTAVMIKKQVNVIRPHDVCACECCIIIIIIQLSYAHTSYVFIHYYTIIV